MALLPLEPGAPALPAMSAPVLLDVELRMALADGQRRFTLDLRFVSTAPITVLYGPSGAGKSLCLQAIAGLRQPSQGHVRVNGRSLLDCASGLNMPAHARGMAYVFQQYALFPHLSVRQNIGFGLGRWYWPWLSAAQAERVDALIAGMGLQAMAHSRPSALSGGQQQRVALARALARTPALLLLDEPFAALNPQLRQEMRDNLRQMRAQWQVPLLMITHDVEDVLALADRALVLEQGRVVRDIDVAALRQGSTTAVAAASPQAQQQAALSQRLHTALGVVPPATAPWHQELRQQLHTPA